MTKSNHNNKPFWLNKLTGQRIEAGDTKYLNPDNWGYWHSELEFRTYQELRRLLPSHAITRQFELEVVPSSPWFPPITWNIDFKLDYINVDSKPVVAYVEAKGGWIRADSEASTAFYRLVATAASEYPAFMPNFALVSDKVFTVRKALKTICINDVWSKLQKPGTLINA